VRSKLSTLLILITSTALSAQTSTTPPQLSPEAAYDQAVTPIEITHRSIANWSDTEIAALGVAVMQAKQACLDRATTTYAGGDLISYAKLCAFGQQWPATLTAATAYIKSTDPAKPQLAQAYAFQVQANLNLADEPAALASSLNMLQDVPYGPITDEVMTATTDYLKITFPFDALTLQYIREPILLDLLRSSQTKPTSTSPTATPSIPPHILFEHALAGAAIRQYTNELKEAAEVVTELDAAIPADLPPDESILIARARRRYALLGTRLPPIAVSAALSLPTAAARINPDFGSSTVLLLFPPWCAQCIRMTHAIAPALLRLQENNVHIYALLADNPSPTPSPVPTPKSILSTHPHRATQPQQGAPAPPDKLEPPPSAADQLRGTPSLIVAPSTLADFAADDFPFLIATDHDGIIRLLLPAAPDNAFVEGGAVDQLTALIAKEWPADTSTTASPAKTTKP
jgi:hypothetical protein